MKVVEKALDAGVEYALKRGLLVINASLSLARKREIINFVDGVEGGKNEGLLPETGMCLQKEKMHVRC